MTTFVRLVWVRGFVLEVQGKVLFISFSNVSACVLFCFCVNGYPTFWESVGVFNVYLLNGEFLHSLFNLRWIFGSWSLWVCGMLSINQIFKLEWEFLKFAGRFFVSDNCFVLDSRGFSVWLILAPFGNDWFAFWSVDDTDIWFDDEWIWFNWTVDVECKIWFFVWEWQHTDLISCLLWTVRYLYQLFFAERMLHLRHSKNGSALLALMHLFILLIYFLFIPEHCGWIHCPHLLQLIQSILLLLLLFWLLVFLIIEDSVSGWLLLHMWHTQLQSSELHVILKHYG